MGMLEDILASLGGDSGYDPSTAAYAVPQDFGSFDLGSLDFGTGADWGYDPNSFDLSGFGAGSDYGFDNILSQLGGEQPSYDLSGWNDYTPEDLTAAFEPSQVSAITPWQNAVASIAQDPSWSSVPQGTFDLGGYNQPAPSIEDISASRIDPNDYWNTLQGNSPVAPQMDIAPWAEDKWGNKGFTPEEATASLEASYSPLLGYDASGNWVNDKLVRTLGQDASIFRDPRTDESLIRNMVDQQGNPVSGPQYGAGGGQRAPIGDKSFPTNAGPRATGIPAGAAPAGQKAPNPLSTLPPALAAALKAITQGGQKAPTPTSPLKSLLNALKPLVQAKAAFAGKQRTAPPPAGPTQGTNAMRWNRMATGGPVQGQGASCGALGLLRGGQTGQSDKVPAKLSHGEYVMDADVVSALGDGNTEAGAAKLDQMRHAIRSHKRSAGAGDIPPQARAPMQYLKGV